MNKTSIIQQTAHYVKETLKKNEAAHDWWHVYRVWNTARHIAEKEKADMFTIELGALLHDIADFKFYNGDEDIGPQKAKIFLASMQVDQAVISHVEKIVAHISFKGKNHQQAFRSPELDVIQDADRLDAMGAIGIARTFNYGGFRNRAIYDPDVPPQPEMDKEAYKKSTAPTINHFYEKLLLLKERMNTETGKKMAEERHRFMETFLERFFLEWSGG
jgi:uncharacterized protein